MGNIDLGIGYLDHDPNNGWEVEEFDGWILDENGNRVFIGFLDTSKNLT